ncbi:hypothetical protein LTR50_006481 [Elasticomyces elasticus]|nr:hypothetical protein LTR50_006481 [Elasticomyces elasticus]
MSYLVPIQRPSSVRHALKLNFLSPWGDCLVAAKSNRLEFYDVTSEGLILRHTKTLYGKVTMLHKLRPASAQTDHLFVGTDRYMYFTLSFDWTTNQLHTEKSYQDMAEKAARESQTGDRCHIDPTGRYMTLEIHEGVVNIMPIGRPGRKKSDVEVGALCDPIPTRIAELSVRSSTFLHRRRPEKDKPRLALLYEDSQNKVRLKIRELDHNSTFKNESESAELNELEDGGYNRELELGASHLIPLAAPCYGLLILGESSISYYNDLENHVEQTPLEEATIFVAWEQIDDQRFVLADEYGRLYLLMVKLSNRAEFEGWQLDQLGETSRASTLVYLDAGLVFVGSHQGDSQVIKITPQSMEIIQTFPNIAPILDFAVMDMGSRSSDAPVNEYSSGQARIVTGSGAYKDGSLRSVRSGVGLDILGTIAEMAHITGMFDLKIGPDGHLADTLIVSFINHTRVLHFDEVGEIEELPKLNVMSLDESTLFASSPPGNRALQVTPSNVRLMDLKTDTFLSDWQPADDQSITAVTATDDFVLVASRGTNLTVLSLKGATLPVQAQRSFDASSQIACVAMSSILPNICIVGFWQNAAFLIMDLQSLETISTNRVEEDNVAAVPRSLLIANVVHDQSPTLFVGMADGTVVTYSIDPENYSLSSRKSMILGTQEAQFKALPRGDGLVNVFATCEHPSLIYGSEGRIVYSAVTAEKATCVCPMDTIAFPDSIVIASADDLKLARVDEERTTHVQSLPIHETVRRVAYSPDLKAFGLGTIKRTLRDSIEEVESHFKLTDEVLFQELDTYPLNQDELVEAVIRAKLDDGSGELAERFIVGTAYLEDEDNAEKVKGRILVFEVTAERKIKVVSEIATKGACRCLATCQGNIVAALTKTVVLYSFEYETSSKPFLAKKASYRTATAPIDLAITDDIIAVTDLMKSVTLLQYGKGERGLPDSLVEVARHFDTLWGTTIANVDENTYLEGDAEGNLIVLNREVTGFSEDDRRRLRVTSEILLGEMPNRIRRIDVQPTPNAVVIPRAFIATTEGSIYLFALITPGKQDLLMRLQASLAEHVKSPGNVPFMKFRAFRSLTRWAEEPMRFVDGELIEKFLDCKNEVQESIVDGLGVGIEEVRGMVENLKRLH